MGRYSTAAAKLYKNVASQRGSTAAAKLYENVASRSGSTAAAHEGARSPEIIYKKPPAPDIRKEFLEIKGQEAPKNFISLEELEENDSTLENVEAIGNEDEELKEKEKKEQEDRNDIENKKERREIKAENEEEKKQLDVNRIKYEIQLVGKEDFENFAKNFRLGGYDGPNVSGSSVDAIINGITNMKSPDNFGGEVGGREENACRAMQVLKLIRLSALYGGKDLLELGITNIPTTLDGSLKERINAAEEMVNKVIPNWSARLLALQEAKQKSKESDVLETVIHDDITKPDEKKEENLTEEPRDQPETPEKSKEEEKSKPEEKEEESLTEEPNRELTTEKSPQQIEPKQIVEAVKKLGKTEIDKELKSLSGNESRKFSDYPTSLYGILLDLLLTDTTKTTSGTIAVTDFNANIKKAADDLLSSEDLEKKKLPEDEKIEYVSVNEIIKFLERTKTQCTVDQYMVRTYLYSALLHVFNNAKIPAPNLVNQPTKDDLRKPEGLPNVFYSFDKTQEQWKIYLKSFVNEALCRAIERYMHDNGRSLQLEGMVESNVKSQADGIKVVEEKDIDKKVLEEKDIDKEESVKQNETRVDKKEEKKETTSTSSSSSSSSSLSKQPTTSSSSSSVLESDAMEMQEFLTDAKSKLMTKPKKSNVQMQAIQNAKNYVEENKEEIFGKQNSAEKAAALVKCVEYVGNGSGKFKRMPYIDVNSDAVAIRALGPTNFVSVGGIIRDAFLTKEDLAALGVTEKHKVGGFLGGFLGRFSTTYTTMSEFSNDLKEALSRAKTAKDALMLFTLAARAAAIEPAVVPANEKAKKGKKKEDVPQGPKGPTSASELVTVGGVHIFLDPGSQAALESLNATAKAALVQLVKLCEVKK
jgi:hypothetical protein